MTVDASPPRFALITPSYAPDFERCELLVESARRCLTDDTVHYVVVDRRDTGLFNRLASSRTRILVVEDILPRWIFRVPGLRGWWASLRTMPIRNWVLQQLVKLSICDVVDADVLTFCDSDNTFVRPFDMRSRLMEDGRVALLRVSFQNSDVRQWVAASKSILGVEDREVPAMSYVSNMITWRVENVLRMRRRIEEVHGAHWIRVVCRHWNISEYMLYGVYIDHVLGLEAGGHYHFDTELMKASWSDPLDSPEKIDAFFGGLRESHIGVMIHSKHGVPVDTYADKVSAAWPREAAQGLVASGSRDGRGV